MEPLGLAERGTVAMEPGGGLGEESARTVATEPLGLAHCSAAGAMEPLGLYVASTPRQAGGQVP
jgi:hypothetical protein